LDVLVAPKFLIDEWDDLSSLGDTRWTLFFRPWAAWNGSSTYVFNTVTGTAGIFGGSDNWPLNGRYKYNLSLSIATDHDGNNVSFTVTPSFTTEIVDASGYATFSNDEMCKISGADVYVVNETKTSYVKLDKKSNTTIWPEKEGVILKGAQDDEVTITAVASDATPNEIGVNYLVGVGNSITEVTANENTYVFANGETGVGFYLASETGNLAAHKAYLDLSRSSFNAREFLSFSFNDETGINEVSAANNSDAIYNLQGVRQNQLQKGLNIVNGKKVLVK
jgi:hypothetical protein